MGERPGAFDVDVLLGEAGWIRALAHGLAAWPEDARELEQETWLAALRARPSTERGLRPWLASVMRNASRALARDAAHRDDRERAGARREALPSAEALAERADLQRALVAEVLALDEPQRSTVLLCFYEGLSPAEIAARQGIPAGSVRSRLSRALAELRRRLDDRAGGDRSRWLSALVPLAPPTALVASSVLLMKKLVLSAAVLGLFGWFAWTTWRTPATDPARPESSADVALATPPESGPTDAEPQASEAPARVPVAEPAPAAPPAPAKVRIRLVDDQTGERVPAFTLALLADGGKTIESDANGEFEVTATPGSDLRFDLVENLTGGDQIQTRRDMPAQISRVSLPVPAEVFHETPPDTFADTSAGTSTGTSTGTPGQVLEFKIPVGPTWRLALQVPPGHELGKIEATLKCADPRKAFDVARAHVRESLAGGGLPWLRFRPAAYFVAGGPPWKLELVTADGLWSASTELTERRGIAPEPVVLTFEPRSRVRGRVRDADGKPIVRQWVRLARPGASFDTPANRPMMKPTDEQGGFDYRAVPPGEWTLAVELDGYEPWSQPLTLSAGDSREIGVELVRAAPDSVRTIEVLVRSSTGRYDDAFYVSVFPVGGKAGRGDKVTWSGEPGARVGRLELPDAKPGRYRVGGRVPGLFVVEPASIEIEAGVEPARFLVRDDVDAVPLHVRAFTAAGELEKFSVILSMGERSASAAATAGLAVIEHIPRGTRCEYEVRADGCAPSWGECVIDGGTTPEQPMRFELSPGWGTEVTVVDTADQPLEGVRVLFDGEFAGITGQAGRLRVMLPKEPVAVRFDHPGWHLAPGTTIASDTGKFRTWEPFLRAVLEREK